MATTPRLLLANQIYSGTTLKSAASEDPDMLEANLLIPSRQRFWRPPSGISYPATINVDFQLLISTAIKAVGLAMLRAYRGGAGITQAIVYSGTGTTYPTITWTSRATITPGAGVSNLFADINTTAKFWRFAITGSSQWGVKTWLVKSTDVVTLTEGGPGAVETVRQLRGRERLTVLGARLFSKGVTTPLREFSITFPVLTQAQLDALVASEKGNVIYQHIDGKYYEVRHLQPVKWEQGRGSIVVYRADCLLAEVP